MLGWCVKGKLNCFLAFSISYPKRAERKIPTTFLSSFLLYVSVRDHAQIQKVLSEGVKHWHLFLVDGMERGSKCQ